MKRMHSKNSIFLMEILLNVLLFSILLTIGLQFFISAHLKTQATSELYQAVASCENAASVFQSGDGTLAPLLQTYHYSANLENRVLIYLDKNFNTCRKKAAEYTLTATLDSSDPENLSRITIVCRNSDGTSLYRLHASTYRQQSIPVSSVKNRNAHATDALKEVFSWQKTS